MKSDNWDDPLDDDPIRLEARFRELEQDAEIEQLRASMGRAQPSSPGPKQGPVGLDPLAAMKSALDDPAPSEGTPNNPFASEGTLIVLCPGCKAKNRVSLAKLRRLTPLCGQCKAELAV